MSDKPRFEIAEVNLTGYEVVHKTASCPVFGRLMLDALMPRGAPTTFEVPIRDPEMIKRLALEIGIRGGWKLVLEPA